MSKLGENQLIYVLYCTDANLIEVIKITEDISELPIQEEVKNLIVDTILQKKDRDTKKL